MKNSLTGEGYGRSRFGGKVCADLELHFRHPVSYEVGSGIHEFRDQAMDSKWNMNLEVDGIQMLFRGTRLDEASQQKHVDGEG